VIIRKLLAILWAATALVGTECEAQSKLVHGKNEPPVRTVASKTFPLSTSYGIAEMPLEISLDWNGPQPQVTRAVVMFHGRSRNVVGCFRSLRLGAKRAGGDVAATTILVAPQFLNEQDAQTHHLPRTVLRWRWGTWESGDEAVAPAPFSAFEVIDAIIAHLSDRRLFPNLKVIVLAGHSGGGQAMQRYAVVGRAEQMTASGVRLRYVVANPSSYLYFTDDRPIFDGETFQFHLASGKECGQFNYWRYGTLKIHSRYVRNRAESGWQTLEEGYARKEVMYLLGTADIDPREKDLDITCAGEMQGPNRFLRGRAYFTWLRARHQLEWNQQMWFLPGIAHSANRMFTSECGVAALFGSRTCTYHQ